MSEEGSLALMNQANVQIEDSTHLPETLDRNYLCKVSTEGVELWRILCLRCRNSYNGFKRVSMSTLDCEDCGQKAKSNLLRE